MYTIEAVASHKRRRMYQAFFPSPLRRPLRE
jgi:hypothetical protein